MPPVAVRVPKTKLPQPSLIMAYSAALNRMSPVAPAPIPMILPAVNCETFAAPTPVRALAMLSEMSVSVVMLSVPAPVRLRMLLTVITPAAPELRVTVPVAVRCRRRRP